MLFPVVVNSCLEARYKSKVSDRTVERDIHWISRKEAWKAEDDWVTFDHSDCVSNKSSHACQ